MKVVVFFISACNLLRRSVIGLADLLRLICLILKFMFLLFKTSLLAIALYAVWMLQGVFAKADALDAIIQQVETKERVEELSLSTMINEGYKLKAYKCPGGQWTICQGITRFKSKKQLKNRQCYLVDANKRKKGYWCFIKKGDVVKNETCRVYFNDYARYLLKKIEKNIINYNDLSKEQISAIFDLLFYYGESKKNAKDFIDAFNEVARVRSALRFFSGTREQENFLNELFFLAQVRLRNAILKLEKKGDTFNTRNRVEKNLTYIMASFSF